jgi:hypothetical protein
MLGRLRKLVFNIRHRSSTPHFVESIRRLNRLARLMTICSTNPAERPGEKVFD